MYLNSFNLFRAVAIILIVGGHTFDLAGMKLDHFIEKVIANLITGGTALFVFISGFLFHHIFYSKYNYLKFIKSKAKNVLIPYIVLGVLPIVVLVVQERPDWGGIFLPTGDGIFDKYIVPTLKYYFTGRFLIAYWYIPFIFTMFVLSPLHIRYIKSRTLIQIFVLVFFSIIALFIHRPVDSIGLLQSLLYFTPFYLLGIFASIHKLKIYDFCEGKEIYILIAALLFSFAQTFMDIQAYTKEALTYAGIDLMFFQKVALSFFFMVFLKRFESLDNKFINTLAATSFTVYFIHSFFLYGISKLNSFYNIYPKDSWFIYTVLITFIIVSCVIIAKLMKKVTPKYSRYITGF